MSISTTTNRDSIENKQYLKDQNTLIIIDSESQTFEMVSYIMKTYPLIFILIVGLLGNGMIFYVFLRRPNFRTSTIARYIKILVVTDTLVLLCGTLQNIYSGFTGQPIDAFSTVGCVLYRFIMFASGDIAIWTLVIMTFDRFVAVVIPTKNQQWKSPLYTTSIEVSLCVLSLIKNFPVFFTFVQTSNGNSSACKTREHMVFYEHKVRTIISLVFYYLMPVISITVLTVLILRQMHNMTKRLSAISRSSRNGKNQGSVGSSHQHTYSKSLTRMCIAINILFFLLITPSITIWTLFDFLDKKKMNKNLIRLFYDITNILVFSHHSLNFYLFFLTGPRFRREVLSIICGSRYKIGGNVSTECYNKNAATNGNSNDKGPKTIVRSSYHDTASPENLGTEPKTIETSFNLEELPQKNDD